MVYKSWRRTGTLRGLPARPYSLGLGGFSCLG